MGYAETLAKRLHQYMKEKGITILELCERAHVSRTSVAKYLKSESGATLGKLEDMERNLGLPSGWLLSTGSPSVEGSVPFYNRIEDAFGPASAEPDNHIALDENLFGRKPVLAGIITTDSMSPSISRGDVGVFSDAMADDKVLHQGIYWIKAGQNIVLGRPVPTSHESVSIIFENPSYPSIEFRQDEMEIKYRLIGCVRRL